MPEPITVVAGLHRCGSSLVMKMLRAGGMDLVWDETEGHEFYMTPIIFEHSKMLCAAPDADWMVAECSGKAVKMKSPVQSTLPVGLDYRFIFCTRDHRQQAKSNILMKLEREKWLNPISPRTHVPKGEMRKQVRRLDIDEPKARRILEAHGCPMLELRFEDMLGSPSKVAKALATFCGLPFWPPMAAVILERSARCSDSPLEYRWLRERRSSKVS